MFIQLGHILHDTKHKFKVKFKICIEQVTNLLCNINKNK